MKIFASFRTLPLLVAAAALLFTGCSPQKPSALRIGINAWPGYEFLYLAQEKGFYLDEGLDAQIIEFSSLTDSRRAYERGQIDGFGGTVTEVLQARENSARAPQIVQVVDYSNGADVILTRPGITTAASLKGARVGVELASVGIYVLARGLENHGLSLAEVEIVSMDQGMMEQAMRESELDAVVTYPPSSVKLLRDGKADTVFSTAEVPGEVIDLIAVDAEVARTRPADVAKLLRAFNRALVYTQQNPSDACRIMAAREGITPAEFQDALTNGIRMLSQADQAAYLAPGGKTASVIAASDRILRQSGQIKGPNRTSDILNSSFVRKEHSR